MTFSVHIQQWHDPIAVEMGQTILEAALQNGVPYPHGCRSGNCGGCKSRLICGDVEMSPYSEYALTEAEKSSGLILACRAVPWEDTEVAWLSEDETAVHPLRRLTCRVAALENLTHDIVRMRLDIESGGPFLFSAGQYCEVRFDGLPARDYSMANRPGDAALEFHVRIVPGGAVSAHIGGKLAVGDTVRVAGPYGNAWLRRGHRGPVLALAGGSGLAPILSIVSEALAQEMKQDIHLYFGVRDTRDLYMQDELAALFAAHPNLRVVPVLSEPAGPTRYRTGFLHEAVARDLSDLDGFKAYLAGPRPMVEAATALLTGRGMASGDIHADAFYTAAEKADLEEDR